MKTVRLLIAEDHGLVRASMRNLLGAMENVEVVAEARDGREAVELAAQHRPMVVIMDISMPGLNGLEATQRIIKDNPACRVIVLSAHADEANVLRALKAGAAAYVLKASEPLELELAIESVARGERFLSPAISKQVIESFIGRTGEPSGPLEQLSPRQREVLQLIANGNSSKKIAEQLGMSVKTVESHRASLMERLDIHDVAGLVRFAVRHGLVESGS